MSIPDYFDRKTQAPAIEDATLFTGRTANLNEGGNPEQLRALAVTPSFFSTLQRQPFLGRGFTEEEAKPDADKFVILTYGLWTSHYAAGSRRSSGATSASTASRTASSACCRPISSCPARDIALLMPFAFTPAQMSDNARGNEFSQMIARLRPGATIAQLNEQMKVITEHVTERLPARAGFMKTSQFGGFAVAMRDQLVGDVRTPIYMLQVGVLLVLFIACANVANLILMRATGRNRELAIRTHARRRPVADRAPDADRGAGHLRRRRGRRHRASACSDCRRSSRWPARRFPGTPDASLNPIVLGFTFALAILTGLVFGIIPALAITRGNAAAFLQGRQPQRHGEPRHRRDARRSSSSRETTLAVMLLIGAGLLLKSFARLQSVDPGFAARQRAHGADRAAGGALSRRRRVSRVLGAAARAVARHPRRRPRRRRRPTCRSTATSAAGRTRSSAARRAPGEAAPHGRQEVVGGDYFKAMHIPLIAGPHLQRRRHDRRAARRASSTNTWRRSTSPSGDALGQQIQRGGPTSPKFTIVGVVGTINSIDLGSRSPRSGSTIPLTQQPQARGGGMALVLKTGLDPADARAAGPRRGARHRSRAADRRRADDGAVGVAVAAEPRRTNMTLLTIFGAVALVLSAIGIYGVLAFGVAQRVREFGIRQALGADRSSILSLVLKQGLRTAGLGMVLGLAGVGRAGRYLQSLLFGVTPHDASVFGGVTVLLFVVAMAACYIPARRATRVDPMVALRDS